MIVVIRTSPLLQQIRLLGFFLHRCTLSFSGSNFIFPIFVFLDVIIQKDNLSQSSHEIEMYF